MPQIDTAPAENAYNQGVKQFQQGLADLTTSQNQQLDATRASFDPTIKNLQDQLNTYNDQITKIRGTLNTLPTDVLARGNGMGSTAQINRQVAAESAPLNQNLSALGIAAAPVSTALSTAQTNQNNAITALQEKFAREQTGYTAGMQAQLNALLDKLNSQRTLNAADMQQAYDLAKIDAQYKQTMAQSQSEQQQWQNMMGLLGGGSTSTSSSPSLQSPDDITQELQSAFKSGQGLTNDVDIIKSIMDDTGMSQQEATNLYYTVRKPYEQPAKPAGPTLGQSLKGGISAFGKGVSNVENAIKNSLINKALSFF